MVDAGSDIGGTFTDVVVHDPATGRIFAAKTPTVASAPADGALRAVARVLADAGRTLPDLRAFVHGTTIATNAVLQRRLPRTALVTNAGFEDLLEIGRQERPHLYDAERQRPPPIVARGDCIGVAGRLGPDGVEIEPVRIDAQALAARLAGVEAVAVSLLHSYASSAHEQVVARKIAEARPDLPVSLSSEIAPEFREYERTSTTALNAALVPVLSAYLADLEQRLASAAPRAQPLILESSGGVLPPRAVRRRPVSAILSGPAGGALACADLAREIGAANLVGIDVGGTSADVSLVLDGVAASRPEARIAGLPVRTPILDIETIGAGGGSIAYREGSFLRVGPRSAEAVPGPACYGRGGTEPTLTDAQVALGRLPEDALAASGVHLRPELAQEAVGRLAKELAATLEETALGIVAVANARMAGAIRVLTTARGLDPATFALCGFGGAGPLHAVELARELGIPRVVIPRLAGVFSAFGALGADLRHDFVRTEVRRAEAAEPAAAFAPLLARAQQALDADAVAPAARALTLSVDARLAGQSHELAVRASADESGAAIAARFFAAYAARYGRDERGADVEIVNWRVAAFGRRAAPRLPPIASGPVPAGRPREVTFDGGRAPAQVYDLSALHAGNEVAGPAIVLSAGSTFLLPPGARAEVDARGNLLVEVGA